MLLPKRFPVLGRVNRTGAAVPHKLQTRRCVPLWNGVARIPLVGLTRKRADRQNVHARDKPFSKWRVPSWKSPEFDRDVDGSPAPLTCSPDEARDHFGTCHHNAPFSLYWRSVDRPVYPDSAGKGISQRRSIGRRSRITDQIRPGASRQAVLESEVRTSRAKCCPCSVDFEGGS
jgi:hypothetical protein